jgi:glucose-6-phosphate isomerase
MLGSEFVKTKGHYHIGAYQEVYIVLEGQAVYLMQKPKNENEIEDVYVIKAGKGDVIIIPSYYGHVTINSSETEELKMANWVSNECKSDYEPFVKNKGACYYYLKKGWVKNENYKSVPELRFEEPLNTMSNNLDFLK